MREWERFSTTVANAYVQPLMASYLAGWRADSADRAGRARFFMMLSGGGLTTIETACRFPIRLVESGPPAARSFPRNVARQRGLTEVLSFDMGGTTAKICLIDDFRAAGARAVRGRPRAVSQGSGLPLRIPVIEMVEIGAGGGSIAHARRARAHRGRRRKARAPIRGRPATAAAARARR